jgi:hypothetical protein
MKKIPPGAEAANILVGEVDFLTNHHIVALRGMTSGRRYLIRGVVFDRNGLITEEMHYIIFYCDIL